LNAPHWGATLLPSGGAAFALWAPPVSHVALVAADRRIEMASGSEGWWHVETDGVPVGGNYSFEIDSSFTVPDPAARALDAGVHGAARLVDPDAFTWRCDWQGRPWEEAVVYELHVGTFTPDGTFDAAIAHLPWLADLGVTAIELMPVASFAGARGWGYDGVGLFAPHVAYGGPEGLKRLVDAAHALGLMVLLDVVHNHFGPDGNHIGRYAPDFFEPRRKTPWGPAIAYERPAVRQFFTQNAAYWIGEYRLDGLRLDAIDQIEKHPQNAGVMAEIAQAARAAGTGRRVHLTTEDDRNVIHLHPRDAEGRPILYTAEWNDDFHHVAHVAATGETVGYYADYADEHAARMVRMLTTGFDYQGTRSAHLDRLRGEPSGGQPPTAFVNFIQNHDQIGNRAMGDRLTTLAVPQAVQTLTAILLLSPQIPLLFMGEEWGETRPFLFFTDFDGDLARAVAKGRRAEFAYWPAFADAAARAKIPNPNAPETFAASTLDWAAAKRPEGAARAALIRHLLNLRATEIAPRLAGMRAGSATGTVLQGGAFTVSWRLGGGAALRLTANIADKQQAAPAPNAPLLYETAPGLAATLEAGGGLAPWSAVWTLVRP
jgi:maltooligosyltrehalose trehalohydrolase